MIAFPFKQVFQASTYQIPKDHGFSLREIIFRWRGNLVVSPISGEGVRRRLSVNSALA